MAIVRRIALALAEYLGVRCIVLPLPRLSTPYTSGGPGTERIDWLGGADLMKAIAE